PNKIINIHPALLPKYGGKGMYGHHVHEAVVAAGERESGITIHYVNENYDEGAIIFQARCELTPFDTPETVAEKVHQLEYKYFPETIKSIVTC
ncbi:MAG: phosphoribosylglycinamide formyltransferase, partial [Paludibacter sp.]